MCRLSLKFLDTLLEFKLEEHQRAEGEKKLTSNSFVCMYVHHRDVPAPALAVPVASYSSATSRGLYRKKVETLLQLRQAPKKIVSTIITNPRGDQYIQVRIRSADDLHYSRSSFCHPAVHPSGEGSDGRSLEISST